MEELISIAIPFRNGARFFDEAIDSIFRQTYPNWEVLFVDDGSTDASSAKALQLARSQPDRFKHFAHPNNQNRGPAASRNLAMRNARGQFITFLDIDDIWFDNKLERQRDVLIRHPEVVMVYGPLYFWYGWTGLAADAAKEFTSAVYSPVDVVIDPPAALARQIQTSDGLPGTCSFLMRRRVIDEGIWHDEGFVMYEDEVFFSKIALRYRLYFMCECLDRYRQHPESTSAQAVQHGIYVMGQPNPSRQRYLLWLKEYLRGLGDGHQHLTSLIDEQLAVYGS
jgi:glycosyltransferase involved in cell wall biosynthesis